MSAKTFAARRGLRIALLAVILLGLVASFSMVPVVGEFELRLADTYFRTAPPLRPSPVVLVLIDDQSLRDYGRWPWSRSTVARLVHQLDAAGAQVIGLDILFAEPQSPAADAQLADAIRASRRTVLADKIGTYPDGPRWIEPIAPLADAAVAVGHSQSVLDGDGICRRFPPRELSVEGPRLGFALEVARYLNRDRAAQFLAQYGISDVDLHASVITAAPILAPIAFRRDPFPAISAADILAGRNLAVVRRRPVLVGFGPTEIADRLTTPLSGQLPTPGVEIHAQILDSVLSGRSLRALPPLVNALLVLLTCVGAVAIFRNRKGWQALVLLTCLAAMAYFVGWALFVLQFRIPPIGPMLLAVFFAPLVVYGSDFVIVERSVRRQMSGLRQWLVQHRPYQLGEDPDDIARKLDTMQELQTQLGSLYELHDKLLEASHEAIGVFDHEGKLLLQNRRFQQLFSAHPRLTTLEDARSLVAWGEQPPHENKDAEAHVGSELYSVRQVALPPTTLSPSGGTIWMLSSLQAREERDRARAEVLGFVTHELRTPMTAIQGFAELMMQFPGSPHCERAPETIYRESKRLLALIHSYLDVLRLDAGARAPAIEAVNVSETVRQVFDVLRPIAAASQMTLAWRGEDALVLADPALLNGAILNVVSNAIKYGERGREISVGCGAEGNEVAIAVHNYGGPIDSRELPQLFSSYYRGTRADERAPGWGLGLAFVKRIAEKHGGRVSVESSEHGTTFAIHLPAAVRQAVAGGVP